MFGIKRILELVRPDTIAFTINIVEEGWIADEEELGKVGKAMKAFVEFSKIMEKAWEKTPKLRRVAIILLMILE